MALWLAASLWVAAFGVSLLLAGILTSDRWMSAPHRGLWAWHGLALATLGAIVIGPLLVAHDILEQTLIWVVHADKQALHLLYAGERPVDTRWNYAILITVASLAAVVTSSVRRCAATRRGRNELRGRGASLRTWPIEEVRRPLGLAPLLQDESSQSDAGPSPSFSGTATGNRQSRAANSRGRERGVGRAAGRGVRRGVGRPDEDLGSVVPAQQLDAFCIPSGPGRPGMGRIFVTSAAVARLTTAQLHAVVAHEQAHLRRRHHIHVLTADILGGVLQRLGLLRGYNEVVRRLVELDADDLAARDHGKSTVASALLEMALSGPARPRPGLGMTSSMTASITSQRLNRLVTQRAEAPEVPPLERIAVLAIIATLVLAPVLVIVVPAVLLAGSGH